MWVCVYVCVCPPPLSQTCVAILHGYSFVRVPKNVFFVLWTLCSPKNWRSDERCFFGIARAEAYQYPSLVNGHIWIKPDLVKATIDSELFVSFVNGHISLKLDFWLKPYMNFLFVLLTDIFR